MSIFLKRSPLVIFSLFFFLFTSQLYSSEKFSVLTYNLENLFDNKDEPRKRDESFLPLKVKKTEAHKRLCAGIKNSRYRWECLHLDWSDSQLNEKMRRIARVIKGTPAGDGGPDIVIGVEVENHFIADKLRREHLGDKNYPYVHLIEGVDGRGIDPVIWTRFKALAPAQLIPVEYRMAPMKKSSKRRSYRKKKVKKLRGILYVKLEGPAQKPLHVFALHMPAPYHPFAQRKAVWDVLSRRVERIPADELVVVGGDFNITSKEEKKLNVSKQFWKDRWLVSHEVGCKKCEGTYFYEKDKKWSFLDMILVRADNKEKKPRWGFRKKSIQTIRAGDFQANALTQKPISWNNAWLPGLSDHLPLYAEVYIK